MASEALIVTIPATPDRNLSPNGRVHPMKRHRLAQELKGTTIRAVQGAVGGDLTDPVACLQAAPWPLTLHYVVAYESRRRQIMDDDNIKASLKYVQDGLASALGIDDANMVVGTVYQTYDDERRGYIKVAIQPAKEAAA